MKTYSEERQRAEEAKRQLMRIAELEQALRDIKQHQETVAGGMHCVTAAWNIANKALGGGE